MIQIPLKKKYRSAHKGRFKGGENAAPKKKRNKIGYLAHVKRFGEPRKTTLYVNGLTGTGVFKTE